MEENAKVDKQQSYEDYPVSMLNVYSDSTEKNGLVNDKNFII
jgi:hypothetical protein